MKKIIVAIDGSEHAMRAVEKAKEIGRAFDSEITLVNVVEGIHIYDVESGALVMQGLEAIKEAKERSKILLERTKESLKEFDNKVETVLLEGDPPYMLIDYIKKSDADLVIVGSHGVKGLKKYLLGSVVSKVVHHIDRPILIVR